MSNTIIYTSNTVFDLTYYISSLIPSQFPEQYGANGQLFIAFMQAYYEWMESANNPIWAIRNLSKLRDVDTTLPSLLIHFKKKYAPDIQFTSFTDQALFIKNAKSFWRSKGTKNSTKLYFQLIYGVDADLYYPKTTIFTPSDAIWTSPTYLELTDPADNSLYINQEIIGANSGATAFVERYITKHIGTKIIEVFYMSGITGNFQAGEMILLANSDIVVETLPTFTTGSLTDLDIVIGGDSFNIGDIVNLYDSAGFGQGKARVANTQSVTGLVSFTLVDGGYGYTSNSLIIVSENILFLSNVQVSNALLRTPYDYFETVTLSNSSGSIVSANVMGISSNVTLYISNATTGWAVNTIAYQPNTITDWANGTVSSLTVIGSNTVLSLTNVSGVFYSNTVYCRNASNVTIANGYFQGFDTSIGIYDANGTFTVTVGTWLVGGTSASNAVINSISAGVDASFNEGILTNQEKIIASIMQDPLSGNNIEGVPYINLNTNGSNGGVGSNGYGFPQDPFLNVNSIIPPIELTIGTIATLIDVNPGADYNVPPFVLVYEPLIAPMGLKDFVIPINATNGTFLTGETVNQVTLPPNTEILTVNNALAPINFFQLNGGGTGYTNGDIVKAATGSTNATANITTNSTGGIILLITTNYGKGFVPLSTPNIFFTNSTGGTTTGSGANVTANVRNFNIGETVYEANSSANVAVGTIQSYTNSSLGVILTLSVNSVTGTFTTANNVVGLSSNTTANITAVNTSGYSVITKGIIKSGSNSSQLKVKRITYSSDFLSGYTLIGETSGATANALSINWDYTSNNLGWNANITANVISANGSVTNLQVIDSGFGYSNGEIVTFISQDNTREGTAKAIVSTQGFGEGYYASVNGFLSNNAILQDGIYYQTFSYEVRSPLSANQYLDSFKNTLHIPGFAVFPAVYTTSVAQTSFEPFAPNYDQIYIVNVTGSSVNAGFLAGDAIEQGNSVGNVIGTYTTITFAGNTTYFEVGTNVYQGNSSVNTAIGYLADIDLNTSNNEQTILYITNVFGSFVNTSNIYGQTSTLIGYEFVQRINLFSVTGANATTGSFGIDENVFQVNSTGGNTAVGSVNAGNSTLIEINIISGTFVNAVTLYGTSGANASVNGISSLSISVGNTFFQQSQLAELQEIQYFSNTGLFQIGETVYQNQKNSNSENAIEMNTFIGFISNISGNSVLISGGIGYLQNNTPIFGTDTTVDILNVVNAGFLQVGEPVYQNNGTANVANGIIQSIITQGGQGTIVIGSLSGTWSNLYPIVGIVSGQTSIINAISNGVCSAMINGIVSINTVAGQISFVNTTYLGVTFPINGSNFSVNGTVKTTCRSQVGENTFLKTGNSSTVSNVISNIATLSAFNTTEFQQINGAFVITTNSSTILTDANTGATANIIYVTVETL